MKDLVCQKCNIDIKVSKITLKCRKCYNQDYHKEYQIKKKEELKQYKHNWYLEQRKEQLAKAQLRYPETRERRVAAANRWKKRNPGKVNHYTAERRASKLDRTPEWINPESLKEIYINCPKDKTVDHIIPLNNKNVSGLHVPWNLQYLTMSENSIKQAKFDGTYENNSWKKELEND